MNCNHCGTQLAENAVVCTVCGTAVANAGNPVEAPVKERVGLGILGALVGALIGGASIVLLSRMGYVAQSFSRNTPDMRNASSRMNHRQRQPWHKPQLLSMQHHDMGSSLR